MATCPACGQKLPEPPAPEVVVEPVSPFLAMLTEDERARGVRNMHELSPGRQKDVKAALKVGG